MSLFPPEIQLFARFFELGAMNWGRWDIVTSVAFFSLKVGLQTSHLLLLILQLDDESKQSMKLLTATSFGILLLPSLFCRGMARASAVGGGEIERR